MEAHFVKSQMKSSHDILYSGLVSHLCFIKYQINFFSQLQVRIQSFQFASLLHPQLQVSPGHEGLNKAQCRDVTSELPALRRAREEEGEREVGEEGMRGKSNSCSANCSRRIRTVGSTKTARDKGGK